MRRGREEGKQGGRQAELRHGRAQIMGHAGRQAGRNEVWNSKQAGRQAGRNEAWKGASFAHMEYCFPEAPDVEGGN